MMLVSAIAFEAMGSYLRGYKPVKERGFPESTVNVGGRASGFARKHDRGRSDGGLLGRHSGDVHHHIGDPEGQQ
jgi:hypothetical protein